MSADPPDAREPGDRPWRHPLLEELLTRSLDEGYAQAAARRSASGGAGGRARPRWIDGPAIAIGCLLAGFLVAIGYVHANRVAPQSQQVHDDLITRVRDAQSVDAELGRDADALQRALAAARARALPDSGLTQRLAGTELAAGQTAVRGPGLVVTLREPPAATASPAPGRGGTVPITQTNILTDRDVRSVVNELWHDGADAIAVNGVRLTPTSAIRFAGQAVLVDFRSIASPYSVAAIGPAEQLDTRFAESAVASRYQTLAGVDGIGFTFATADQLTLPAGSVQTLRYARPGAR